MREERAGWMREAGFTLLELLIVLTILALLSAVAPRLLPHGGTDLQVAARDLAATLRDLRGQAMRQGTPTRLVIAEHAYTVGKGALRRLPNGIGLHLRETAPDLLGLQERDLRFFEDGSATGGDLVLTEGRRSIQVTVSWLDGQVAVHD